MENLVFFDSHMLSVPDDRMPGKIRPGVDYHEEKMTPLLSKLHTSGDQHGPNVQLQAKRDERQIISDGQITDEDSRVRLSQISVLPLTQ